MYLLGPVILLILFYYGFDIVKNAMTYFSKTNNYYLAIGNPWFYGLVGVNIIITIFVIYFYYKKNGVGSIGETGNQGMQGKKGPSGNSCYFSKCY